MTTYLDYAALSGLVYNNVRGPLNVLTSLPPGGTELPIYPTSITSAFTGFIAVAFQNTQTNEIVIAFKGTDSGDIVQMAQDFVFGNTAALGGSPRQHRSHLRQEQ